MFGRVFGVLGLVLVIVIVRVRLIGLVPCNSLVRALGYVLVHVLSLEVHEGARIE